MIVSSRDDWLRAFFVEDTRSRNIPTDLEGRLFRKLQLIDDATTDQDLRVPPSNHFEKLRGNLAGMHSIRVNKQWRLVFQWDGNRGEAEGVYLDDQRLRGMDVSGLTPDIPVGRHRITFVIDRAKRGSTGLELELKDADGETGHVQLVGGR